MHNKFTETYTDSLETIPQNYDKNVKRCDPFEQINLFVYYSKYMSLNMIIIYRIK